MDIDDKAMNVNMKKKLEDIRKQNGRKGQQRAPSNREGRLPEEAAYGILPQWL